jgi:hypothetical protein
MLAGLAFNLLLKQISDTQQIIPDGLADRCSAVLTVEPKKYQLASIGFIEQVCSHIAAVDLTKVVNSCCRVFVRLAILPGIGRTCLNMAR